MTGHESSIEGFVERFVVGLSSTEHREDPKAVLGTGVLLGPRVVATCRHVVAFDDRVLRDDVWVWLGDTKVQGEAKSWHHDDDPCHDVAFVVLCEPLGTGDCQPALVFTVTNDFVERLRDSLQDLRDGLMSSGYRSHGPIHVRARMAYADRARHELAHVVRLEESHESGDSGGPVWLVAPPSPPPAARGLCPGLVLGLLVYGGNRAPHSFFITSNALLELREWLCRPNELSPWQRDELARVRVVHSKRVVSWLPVLRGERMFERYDSRGDVLIALAPPTRPVAFVLGSPRLTVVTGTILDLRISHLPASSKGQPAVATHVGLSLRLGDGTIKRLDYSLCDLERDTVRAVHPVVGALKTGRRVTLVWAANWRESRGIIAACHVHDVRRRFDEKPRLVASQLRSPVVRFTWIAASVVVFLFSALVLPHPWVAIITWLAAGSVYSWYEALTIRRTIDELLRMEVSDTSRGR